MRNWGAPVGYPGLVVLALGMALFLATLVFTGLTRRAKRRASARAVRLQV